MPIRICLWSLCSRGGSCYSAPNICSALLLVAAAGADLDIRLVLDRDARLERDARRQGGQSRAGDHAWANQVR